MRRVLATVLAALAVAVFAGPAESAGNPEIAALQVGLSSRGLYKGTVNGVLGPGTSDAVRRFQRQAGLPPDGVAGPTTRAALRAPAPRSPLILSVPVEGPTGDTYGPRGTRFHSGLDFRVPSGTPVAAAGSGLVVFAGQQTGGWGKFVVVKHGSGVRTLYAHLSRINVKLGQQVSSGATIGLVGATGGATGPHLHFEVLVRGAAVDPQTAFKPKETRGDARPPRGMRTRPY